MPSTISDTARAVNRSSTYASPLKYDGEDDEEVGYRTPQTAGCPTNCVSLRHTTRVIGAAKNTIVKLLTDLQEACAGYRDGDLAKLGSERIGCDEIWAFCYGELAP